MAKYQAYAEYKDSGVEWFQKIPINWNAVPLKYMCKGFVKDGPHETPKFIDSGIPFLSVDGIQNCKLIFDGCRYISQEDHERYSLKCKPVKGDILLGKAASVGKVAYVDTNIEFNVWSPLAVITPKSNNLGKFIYYCIQSGELQIQCEIFSNSNTQKNLGMNTIDNLDFPYPSEFEAIKIINFLDHETAKIDHLIEKQQQLIELLKEKRQAVISHAVTKGLDPNVPMKDSGVEWLGQVPEHWNMAPVRRYLVEHRQGYYTTESYVDEGLKLLRITDLRDLGEINISNCPMVNESDTTHLFKLQKGDVVFARTGGAGSFGVITEDYENLIYASYLIRFRFMNKIFEPDYLRFLFQSDSFQLSVKQNIHGGVNQNIHAEDIKNTVICAPSLSEQKEIIEYLENQCLLFENLIYKASYSVKLMQERRTALISSAVTGKIDVRNWQAPTLAEAHTELSA